MFNLWLYIQIQYIDEPDTNITLTVRRASDSDCTTQHWATTCIL